MNEIPVIPPSFIVYNQQGLIPGPEETVDLFELRAAYCIHLNDTIEEELKESLPFKKPYDRSSCFEKALANTETLYGISPFWIPLFFSNYRLPPWQGGCAWIYKKEDPSTPSLPAISGAFLQLRKTFHQSKKFLRIYDRIELIAHELAHIGRMEFNEPKFEEMLAYQTAHSKWRRWWGPIIQSPWETTLFIVVLLGIFALDLGTVLLGEEALYKKLMWLKLAPLLLVTLAFIRLVIRHMQMKKCLKTLNSITLSKEAARAVLYRLTDREIISLSNKSREQAKSFIEKKGCLRWRIIKQIYMPK